MAGGDEREPAHARVATRGESPCGRTGAIRERLARHASSGLRVLQRTCAANRSRSALFADCRDSAPRRPREPDTVPRAIARHGIARARTATPLALANVRSFLDFWHCERAVCLAGLRMDWSAHRNAEAGPRDRFWTVVDNSRAVRGDRAAPGKRAAVRRTGVDEARAMSQARRK